MNRIETLVEYENSHCEVIPIALSMSSERQHRSCTQTLSEFSWCHRKMFVMAPRMLWVRSVLTARDRDERRANVAAATVAVFVFCWFLLIANIYFIRTEWPKKTCACRMNWYFRSFLLFAEFFVSCFLSVDNDGTRIDTTTKTRQKCTHTLVPIIISESVADNNKHQQQQLT